MPYFTYTGLNLYLDPFPVIGKEILQAFSIFINDKAFMKKKYSTINEEKVVYFYLYNDGKFESFMIY